MFIITFVDLEYETGIFIWEFEMMIVLNYGFAFIRARYMIKFTEQKWGKMERCEKRDFLVLKMRKKKIS